MDSLRPTLVALLPRLRRFGIALTGSAGDAEDLVQDACERALNRHGQLREEVRLDAWIYSIMRHLWTDRLRARRIRRHEALDEADDIPGEDGAAVAEGRIALAAVRRTLAAMSAEHRAVLTLVCIDGLSYREAADVLAVPVGTVMSRLSRARLDLHARLASPERGSVVALPTRARPNGSAR